MQASQLFFNVVESVLHLARQRFAVFASNKMYVITLWKIPTSAGALPQDNGFNMCCYVVSHISSVTDIHYQ